MSETELTTSELLVLSGCARQSGEGWEKLAEAHPYSGDRYMANAEYMYGIRDKIEAIVAERDRRDG